MNYYCCNQYMINTLDIHYLPTVRAMLPSGAVRDIIFLNEILLMNDQKYCEYYW